MCLPCPRTLALAGGSQADQTQLRLEGVMRRVVMFCVSASLFLTPLCTPAGDTHEARVESEKTRLVDQRAAVLQSLAELEVSLRQYDIAATNEVSAARDTLDRMLKDRAWRDLGSRETRSLQAAKAALDKYLADARTLVEGPRRQLALAKKAEYDAWARANPEAAKIRELEARIADAESEAMNAADRAEEAKRDAQRAQAAAQEAEWRSRQAERRSRDAEDALMHHGISTW